MRRFTDAGRAAIASNNLYAGLVTALMLPDVCASLEDPGTGKSKSRYIRWAEKWVQPQFTLSGRIFLVASDLYQLRCSLIHSGSDEIDPKYVDVLQRFVFCDNSINSHLNYVEMNSMDGVPFDGFLQVGVTPFCETIFDAVDRWDHASQTNVVVQAEKARLTTIHTKGDQVGPIHF